MIDIQSLDGGVLGETTRLRSMSGFCSIPVKSDRGDFIGIMFGPEDALGTSDLEGLVNKVISRQTGNRQPEDAGSAASRCYYGWLAKYSVNPTIAAGYKVPQNSGNWGFLAYMLPRGIAPKDFYRLLFNYGYRFNRAADESAFNGGNALAKAKEGSFGILFYACGNEGALSS